VQPPGRRESPSCIIIVILRLPAYARQRSRFQLWRENGGRDQHDSMIRAVQRIAKAFLPCAMCAWHQPSWGWEVRAFVLHEPRSGPSHGRMSHMMRVSSALTPCAQQSGIAVGQGSMRYNRPARRGRSAPAHTVRASPLCRWCMLPLIQPPKRSAPDPRGRRQRRQARPRTPSGEAFRRFGPAAV